MSTVTVTNIRRTGETASRDTRGIAAAWLNLTGTGTIAINNSQNISSVIDDAVGSYRPQLTSAMASAEYEIQITGQPTSTTNGNQVWGEVHITTPPTTSQYQTRHMSMGAGGSTYTVVDPNRHYSSVNGGMA